MPSAVYRVDIYRYSDPRVLLHIPQGFDVRKRAGGVGDPSRRIE